MGGFSVVMVTGLVLGIGSLMATGLFVIFLLAIITIAILVIITYIFESTAIMNFRKKLKKRKNAISFIPFYNKHLLGEISNNKILGIILALASILKTISFIFWFFFGGTWGFFTFLILLITSFILNNIISNKIFKLYTKYNIMFSIFSIVSFGILRPIFLFAISLKTKNIV